MCTHMQNGYFKEVAWIHNAIKHDISSNQKHSNVIFLHISSMRWQLTQEDIYTHKKEPYNAFKDNKVKKSD